MSGWSFVRGWHFWWSFVRWFFVRWSFVRDSLQTLGVLPRSFLPFPSFPPLLASFLVQLQRVRESDVCKLPHEAAEPGHQTRFSACWGKKIKHYMVLMYCIFSAASYRTATDLFYDGTNHTINYVDDNNALYTRLCRSFCESNTLMQVKYWGVLTHAALTPVRNGRLADVTS